MTDIVATSDLDLLVALAAHDDPFNRRGHNLMHACDLRVSYHLVITRPQASLTLMADYNRQSQTPGVTRQHHQFTIARLVLDTGWTKAECERWLEAGQAFVEQLRSLAEVSR